MIIYQATPNYYDYISHNGVRGQRWGVRNGPPYPLKAGAHSKSEISAGWQKSVKSIDTKTTGIINKKHVKSKSFHDAEVTAARGKSNSVEEVEERIVKNTGELRYVSPAKVIRDFERDLGQNPYEMEPESFSDAASHTNPNYGERGTTNNCTRCAAALELRSKGYDVIAARSHSGAGAFEYETWFKGAKTKGYSSSEECMRDLLRQGDGASGALNGYFGDGLGSGSGGHAVHWSINGRHVEIQDGQSGKIFGSFKEAWDHYGFNDGACFATRLDNCEPDWDVMMEDSVFGINNSARKWRQNGRIFDNF